MHVEKNVFENIFNTIKAIDGKTKDNSKERDDIITIFQGPELAIDELTGKYPKACYSLDKKEKQKQPMTYDRSPNEGIVNKDVGFAKFASPKKRNGEPSDGQDAFALILNKKKCSQSANIGKKDVPNSHVSRTTVDKADDTFQVHQSPANPPETGLFPESGRRSSLTRDLLQKPERVACKIPILIPENPFPFL
ncbi:hypothetical protein AgCh_029383 [Apium graveolens]